MKHFVVDIELKKDYPRTVGHISYLLKKLANDLIIEHGVDQELPMHSSTIKDMLDDVVGTYGVGEK